MKKIIALLISVIAAVLFLACEAYDTYESLPPIHFNESSMCEDLSIDDIKKLNNEDVEISYLTDSNVVQEIKGAYTTIKILTAEDAVASLTSVSSIMKIEDFSFYGEKTENADNTISFELKQLYKGVPVYNGVFNILASKDGSPLSISGTYISGVDFDVELHISKHDAQKLITSGKIISQELMVYKNEYNICYTIWHFMIEGSKGESQCILINAINKAIIVDETIKTPTPSHNKNISEPKVMLLILHETFAFDYWQEAKIIDAEGYCYSVQSNKVSESIHLSEDDWYDKLIKMIETESVFQLTGKKLESISKFAGKFSECKPYTVKEYRSDYNDYGIQSLYGIYIDENNVPQYILLSKYGDAISCIDNKDVVDFVNTMDSRVFFTNRFKY